MSRAVVKLPRSEADLIGGYAYLGEQAGEATADRFLAAVERTLRLIARSPGIGAPHESNNPRLPGLRSLPVSKFKRYILFYRAFDDRIELVRVLHGVRASGASSTSRARDRGEPRCAGLRRRGESEPDADEGRGVLSPGPRS